MADERRRRAAIRTRPAANPRAQRRNSDEIEEPGAAGRYGNPNDDRALQKPRRARNRRPTGNEINYSVNYFKFC